MMTAIVFSKHAPMRYLRQKEFAECRPAILVGLLIFVIIPSLWTLAMPLLNSRDGVFPGIATTLWLLAGWLFAAVLGAQMVCRDLGTPLERFLLGKPITEAQVLRIKGRVGIAVVASLAAAVGGLEWLWYLLEPSYRRNDSGFPVFASPLLIAAGINFFAYSIAFSAACATRRSLTSTLIAAFVLILLVTVPLVIRIPGLPEIGELLYRQNSIVTPAFACLGLVLVSWLAAVVVKRLFASGERRVNIGPRQLAWIAALTLVSLFVLAMNEVGASQPLVTTWWHSKWQTWTETHIEDRIPSMFAVGRQRVALSADDRTVRLIDLDESGRIARNRRLDPEQSTEFLFQDSRMSWAFDGDNNLAMVKNDKRGWRDEEPLADRIRLSLRRIDWESMVVQSKIELPWPSDQELPEYCSVSEVCFEGDRVFIMFYCHKGKKSMGLLVAYQLDSEKATPLASRIGSRVARWRSSFQTLWPQPQHDGPSRRLGVFDYAGELLAYFDPKSSVNQLRHSFAMGGVILEDYNVQADRLGFKVMGFPGNHGRWSADAEGVIGRVRASPWATLFRSEQPRLLAAGPNRWVELHENHAIVYDLSDPAHPRQLAHVTAPMIESAAVTGDLLISDHGLGFSVAKLPHIAKK